MFVQDLLRSFSLTRAFERPSVYTVKQVASLTGVSEATLRAWERRYGVVDPIRSPAGYRLYDEDQLAVLREMASLVHEGVPASRAAEVMREGTRRRVPRNDPVDDLVAAAADLDPLRLRATIAHAFGATSFEQVAERWLPEQIEKVGQAWECGELSVAQEHFASAGLMRAIGNVYTAAEDPNPAQPVLVGLPPWRAPRRSTRRPPPHHVVQFRHLPAPPWVSSGVSGG